jgi:hypothetical protein
MRRSLAILLAVAAALVVAGCGGGGDEASGDTQGSTDTGGSKVTAPDWAAPLLRAEGPESAAVMASSDFAVGPNRVSFLLVRGDSSLVRAPLADVYYRPEAGGSTRKALARLTPFGAAATTEQGDDEIRAVYVTELDLPQPGKQWIVIQPRGVAFQGFQILDVQQEPKAVAIGERAPASANPTTATAPAKRITTARPPDTALLRYSIAESLRDEVPFVVAFATPAYCQTRTCGPTVDVLEAVRKRYESRGIRFIHVEIYEDNLPGNGVNRWVRQWRLPTEPWVFVVDGTGVVRDRFEGAASVIELEKSIRRHLLAG